MTDAAMTPDSRYGELQPENFVPYDTAFLEHLDALLVHLQENMIERRDYYGPEVADESRFGHTPDSVRVDDISFLDRCRKSHEGIRG